jgi:hypothetical protein
MTSLSRSTSLQNGVYLRYLSRLSHKITILYTNKDHHHHNMHECNVDTKRHIGNNTRELEDVHSLTYTKESSFLSLSL